MMFREIKNRVTGASVHPITTPSNRRSSAQKLLDRGALFVQSLSGFLLRLIYTCLKKEISSFVMFDEQSRWCAIFVQEVDTVTPVPQEARLRISCPDSQPG